MLHTVANVLFIVSLLLLAFVLLYSGVGAGAAKPLRPGDFKALDSEPAAEHGKFADQQDRGIKQAMQTVPFRLALVGLVLSLILYMI